MPQDHRALASRRRRWPKGLVVGLLFVAGACLGAGQEAHAARARRKATARTRRGTSVHEAHPADAASRSPATMTSTATSTHARAGTGRVVFVTERRAYLDRGSSDGLQAKQALSIQRAGRPVASCTIEETAAGSAVCVGARLRSGDTFAMPSRAPSPKVAAVVALAPVTPAATLQQRADEVAEATQEKVDFHGVRLFGGHARVQLGASMAFWRTQSDPRFDYAVEQIDGALRAYELGNTGLRVDAAFSALRWTGSGAAVSRFRPDAPTQFYLWQAELSRRHEEAGTVFSVGRIWPWHLPGLPLLDGFQLGRRDRAGSKEAGVYAGFLPTATAVSPATDSWAAGLYGTLTQVGAGRGLFRLAREEARLGIWHPPGGGSLIAEGDGTGQIWLGPTTLAAGGRVRAGGGAGAALERFFIDVALRPTTVLGGGLHLRYFGASPGPLTELARETFATGGSLHATTDVQLQPWPWLGLVGYGGLHKERDSGLAQKHGGAEVRLPRVLGRYAGLGVGAEAQEGWLRLRTLYADLVARPSNGVVAWARVSAAASQIPSPVATAELHELAAQLHVDAALVSWLRVQAWCAVKNPWLIRGEPPPVASAGLTAGLGVRGLF